jgi:tryptophan synthase alpha chain
MNRIDQIFSDLRARQGKAVMPFLTAGDPDVATTGKILLACQEAGASICELGIPFSDPIADGPVIQASMSHALDQGVRPVHVLEQVAAIRSKLHIGVVAMVSYSIVYRLGNSSFIRDAKAAGIDGFIIPDLPVEESAEVREQIAREGLICSLLVAPTTSDKRAEEIARACSGFVYVLSRAGITGEQRELPPELGSRLARLRQVTDLPMAVGFGISTGKHVQQVVEMADAAIVGSAIMRRVAAVREQGSDAVVKEVSTIVRDLVSGLPGSVAAKV